MERQRIGVVGLGYVGLCTSVCLASKGFSVVGIDVDRRKIHQLREGKVPFFENNLNALLTQVAQEGTLCFYNDFGRLKDCDLIFITVGTPSSKSGKIDLSQVMAAARSVGEVLASSEGYKLVIVKSTVPPGTSAEVGRAMATRSKLKLGIDFGVCSNPEFLREGSAIDDTLKPDRLVIGASEVRSRKKLRLFYQDFYGGELPPVVMTTPETAELIKYSNNAFLAMKVSYINSVARICEKLKGVDVGKVAEGIGLDSRIGKKFLQAGPGYGGSCFPKDLRTLLNFSSELNFKPVLLESIETVNAEQAKHVVSIAEEMVGELGGKKIAVLGLAFKAGTDDVREAASLRVVGELLGKKADVRVYDPEAMANFRRAIGDGLTYSKSAVACMKDTDLCIVMTEWEEFSKLKPEHFLGSMKKPRLLDARRLYDPIIFAHRLEYRGIGWGS